MEKRIESTVRGRVQLVMFRDFTKRAARRLCLKGTVQNKPDGTVAIVAEGDEQALRELLQVVRRGSLLSRVDAVDTVWLDPTGTLSRFSILYE